MKLAHYYFLIFPLLIISIGVLMYKVLEYTPDFYTIMINICVAFLLSPRVKTFETQTGTKEQVTWLFFKKSRIIN